MFPILNPPPSSRPIPSLWGVRVHQPQASSIVHRTWTGDLFHTWYYTCFHAILPNLPTLSLSHRVHKTDLYILVVLLKILKHGVPPTVSAKRNDLMAFGTALELILWVNKYWPRKFFATHTILSPEEDKEALGSQEKPKTSKQRNEKIHRTDKACCMKEMTNDRESSLCWRVGKTTWGWQYLSWGNKELAAPKSSHPLKGKLSAKAPRLCSMKRMM